MAIEIRRPEVSDAPRVAEICREGWKQTVAGIMSATYQHQTVTFWYSEDKVAHDIARGQYSYVAVLDGEVAGVIGGDKTAGHSGEIYVFYVDEKYRYQGIGRALLERLTGDHTKKGLKEQWVSVQEGNVHGQPFYEANGFVYERKKVARTASGESQVSLRFRRRI